jgi:hypothetical protein
LITRSPRRQISRFAAVPRLRPLTLPIEHGGWGVLFEPIVIAMTAAPSVPGVFLAGATVATFLARQPLKIVFDDRRHQRQVARTAWARGIAAAYGILATVLLVAGGWPMQQPWLWQLGLIVAPLAAITLAFDARGESRRLMPELTGAAALASVTAAAALAAGWIWPLALALWASALIRALPAILTVRERVMRLHGRPADRISAIVAHGLATIIASALQATGLAPAAVFFVAVVLYLRAVWDLRPGGPPVRAAHVGLRELVTGLAAAGAIGVSWAVWKVAN